MRERDDSETRMLKMREVRVLYPAIGNQRSGKKKYFYSHWIPRWHFVFKLRE